MHVQHRRTGQSHSSHRTGTAALGAGWTIAAVYGTLAGSFGASATGWLWMATVTIVLAAWALLEGKRWARLTMLGVAALFLTGYAVALYPLIAQGGSFPEGLFGFGGGRYLGGLFLGLSAATLAWLTRVSVREEFYRHKRMANFSWQIGISVAALGLVALGLTMNDASRDRRSASARIWLRRENTKKPEIHHPYNSSLTTM